MKPIDSHGRYISPDEISEDDPHGIEAILPNDILVTLISYVKISVGGTFLWQSSEQWDWINERPLPKGTYKLLMQIPQAVKDEVDRRKSVKAPYKAFQKECELLGASILADKDLSTEILVVGLSPWLMEMS